MIEILKNILCDLLSDHRVYIQGSEERIDRKPYIMLQYTVETYNTQLRTKQYNLTINLVGSSEKKCLESVDLVNNALEELLERKSDIDFIKQINQDFSIQENDCILSLGYIMITR